MPDVKNTLYETIIFLRYFTRSVRNCQTTDINTTILMDIMGYSIFFAMLNECALLF